MLRPNRACVSISCDERARVIDRRVHAVRRVRRLRFASRLRAASSSSAVKAPCLASHSATPASPSRTTSARRAASVIHAETLIPSAAAAATMPACTSGSTVMAIFGEGFPRGITKLYSMSRRLTSDGGGSAFAVRPSRSRRISFPRCSAPRPEHGPCRPSRTRSPSRWRLPESAPASVPRPVEAPQLRARRAR
ncbi:MAG: hypothetical protein QOI44_169 [Actinomycetota bacterium]|nr:hypothetical protein [Actinomycetota bacterium]